METGIGKRSDAEIARTLRYSIGHEGQYIFPILMPFHETSDEDLTAIVSYLRSQEPVHNPVPPTKYKFFGKALLAFRMFPMRDTTTIIPPYVVKDSTIDYGRYLATGLANCMGCHTNSDIFTGEKMGEPFAGGLYFEPDQFTQGYSFVSPNLTPDPETGVMAYWNQQAFIIRFQTGALIRTSPMPWGAYSNMDETDLKALYKYLMSLEPVHNKVEQTVYKPGEKFPD